MPESSTPSRTSSRSSGSGSGSADTSTDTRTSVEEGLIKQLTDAILKLAERPPARTERDELVLERRRVDFGYRSLGVLMGRDPAQNGFDLPVFAARWGANDEIELFELPDEVTWVEVTAPGFTDSAGQWTPVRKTLRVVRDSTVSRGDSASGAGSRTRPPRIERDDEIFPRRTIDLLIGLELEDGVGVALGPRLTPVPSTANPR
jgi:hypothetical protein